jgi:hypothetical protein
MKWAVGSKTKPTTDDDTKFCYCLRLLLLYADNLTDKELEMVVEEFKRVINKPQLKSVRTNDGTYKAIRKY